MTSLENKDLLRSATSDLAENKTNGKQESRLTGKTENKCRLNIREGNEDAKKKTRYAMERQMKSDWYDVQE